MKLNKDRYFRINKKDGTYIDLKLCKATKINTEGGMLHLDELKDGNYRLIFSKDIVDDFSTIKNMEII